MKIQDIVEQLQWEVLAGAGRLDADAQGGYVADLLSCVMAGAQPGQLWFTLQTHLNIIAVASLTGVAGIVVTESAPVAPETIAKAEAEGVILLSSSEPTFETLVKLTQIGF
ncbi:MAG: serine kinase [Anaerolineae bacterium]|nr:serine kinase [Anaerolineae bacterium]